MLRRSVLTGSLFIGLATSLLAQDAKTPDRLSGEVKSIDKTKNVIEITPRNSTAVRRIHYDAKTVFTMIDKPSSADEVVQGLRLVAIGKFEGVDLNATAVTLRASH